MGREESAGCLRQPADAVYSGSKLPHCLGRFSACGVPARPAAHPPEPAAPADCPLPPAADKRLPPLIVLLRVVMIFLPVIYVEVIVSQSASANPNIIVSVVVVLLYLRTRHIRRSASPSLHILSVNIKLFMIPGFAENLHSCSARIVPGPSLAGTHFGPQRWWCARGEKRSAAETEVRKRPSDSLHGQTSPLRRLRRHRRDNGGIRRRVT
jgi:hypothetical protein